MSTWSDFGTLLGVGAAFFFAGRLWEHEHQMRREERAAAQRRAHRLHREQQPR